MKIPVLSSWLEKRSQLKASLAKLDEFMDFLVDGNQGTAGVAVTEKTALYSTAVFACVRVLAETVASLPLPVYRRLEPRGKKRAPEHPAYQLLHDQPNPYMTSFVFRETLMGHLATWGNAYAEIEYDPRTAKVKGLWPLRPDRMVDIKFQGDGLVYLYRLPDGTERLIKSYRMLHVAGLGFNGYVGYSPIGMARNAVGLAMATEDFGSRFFSGGARPGGVLLHPGKMKDSGEQLRKQWNEMHSGLSNQHRIAILEEGMEYKQIGIPPGDSQFLETRKFQIQEIARIYRIPPHMLADLERATFSNIEHQSIDFVVHTIRPWLVKWEQAIKQKLFAGTEKEKYFAEFLVDGLLRGDTQTRYQAYATARQWGWLSANDIRELENQNPLPDGGDMYLVPMNMIPADQATARLPESQPPPQEGSSRAGSPLEQRNINAALNRSRIAGQYERLFQDAASRVVKREVSDLKRAVKKHLGERDSTGFLNYLNDYYEKAPEWISRTMMPVLLSLGEAVRDAAAQEVSAGEVDISEWVSGYAERYGSQHAGASRGQLAVVVEQAVAEGQDSAELVSERLDEWEEKRPGKIASRETVEESNKIARYVFMGAGITRLRWVAIGSKPCPYCQELNGKVVGIETPFLGASESLESEDGRMRINKPTLTPQLHDGCVCQIIPE